MWMAILLIHAPKMIQLPHQEGLAVVATPTFENVPCLQASSSCPLSFVHELCPPNSLSSNTYP
jgi:hypothetical protein